MQNVMPPITKEASVLKFGNASAMRYFIPNAIAAPHAVAGKNERKKTRVESIFIFRGQ